MQALATSEINAVLHKVSAAILDEVRREAVVKLLKVALVDDARPAGPMFPEKWLKEEPTVMQHYDDALANFLGILACGRDVSDAQTRGLARRALQTDAAEASRVWPKLFAERVLGPDCPPAKRLPDQIRRELEELAGRRDLTASGRESSPSDAAE